MEEKETAPVEITDEIGRFAETYSSFNNIINQIQRQYLSLKETYEQQSARLQEVNLALQKAISDNRIVSEFLSRILTSLNSGIVAVNRQGEITHINPAAQGILGFHRKGFTEKPLSYKALFEIVEGDTGSAESAAAGGQTCLNAEKKIRTSDGRLVTLLTSTSVLRDESGAVIGAVEIFQDITNFKRMEEELSRTRVLAGLGEMAASIAHEVRNPLVAIGGFAALLARDLQTQPEKLSMAEKIVAGVNNINRTIETLLVFARREEISKVSVDLKEFLEMVIAGIVDEYSLQGQEINIQLNPGDTEGKQAQIDPHLFRQALYNLAKNGIEANPANPTITIRCAVLNSSEAAHLAEKTEESMAPADYLLIAVDDFGHGIPKSDLSKIFSPFYSTKTNGTGLGLSIAWKIIKAHGGEIQASSRPGQGTTFSILLPLNQEVLR